MRIMTAFILKSTGTYKLGFYVICKLLKHNLFFARYRDAKNFCDGKGWDSIRL